MTKDQPVDVGSRPIPEVLTARFPEIKIEAWEWTSPLRLRAEDHRGVLLVVMDRDHTDMSALWITGIDANDPGRVSSTYGGLHIDLGVRIARRIACEDGTPVRAAHNKTMCTWCGAKWFAHEGNGTPE